MIKTIANSFNEYFVKVGPKLAPEIPQSQRSFEMYPKGFDSSLEEVTFCDGKIKTAFFSLKGDKSPGFDEVNYDIVKQNSHSLLVPLKCIFDFSVKSGTFPEKEKIARVTLVYTSGDTSLKTGFQHADFSLSADFFACADFSAYQHKNFHHIEDS